MLFDVRPQPSMDKFIGVAHEEAEDRLIHGNAATGTPLLPYQGFASFGATLLGKCQAAAMSADLLRHITVVDAPEVLSGGTPHIGAMSTPPLAHGWRSGLTSSSSPSMDASWTSPTSCRLVMEVLRPCAECLRRPQRRSLGACVRALFWNLGKILRSPDVVRVYISSV